MVKGLSRCVSLLFLIVHLGNAVQIPILPQASLAGRLDSERARLIETFDRGGGVGSASRTRLASIVNNLGSEKDSELFTPLESLSAVSESEFTRLEHPSFPNHSVRVKKSHFCDGGVNSYTGYIDVQARHLFFYFFESRNDPDHDDVIFWTNGGPGGSSSIGLFMELGPCRVLGKEGPKYHPESWNQNANIFFIDQPIGVGFSYAEYGETVSTTEEAARDVAAFVAIWFENFSKFKGRAFHMAGESYGGRYIPLFAAAIYDQNAMMLKAGMTPINLTSIMIGNGATEPHSLILSLYDMICTPASLPPIVDIGTCAKLKAFVPRCKKWFKEACIDQFDNIDCAVAVVACRNVFVEALLATGLNPYDISKPCEGVLEETLCYPVTRFIPQFLDQPSVRTEIGIDHSFTGNFSSVNFNVNRDFVAALDDLHPSMDYIGALLDRGVRALIYVGTYDCGCNWVGNERWTLALEWSGREEFVKRPLREWSLGPSNSVAGKTRSANGLTFATIDGAGHMVPYDKPKEALAMVQRWLAGEPL